MIRFCVWLRKASDAWVFHSDTCAQEEEEEEKEELEMWFHADIKAHVRSPTVLQQEAVNGGVV